MSRFAGLPAALKGGADKDKLEIEEGDEEVSPDPKTKRKDKDMAEAENQVAVDAARAEGHAAGFKAASDRLAAVQASDAFAGREATAVKLLTKASMASASAEDVIDLLGDVKASPAAAEALTEEQQREAAEEGGRKEMKAALADGKNSNIDPGEPGKPDAKASADAIWDTAFAANDALRPTIK